VKVAVAVLAVAALAAGCGGSTSEPETPTTAYLTGVTVGASSVRFDFEGAPLAVRARFEPRANVAECGSGMPIELAGRASAVVHFTPAASAKIEGEKVVPTYTGPKRLHGPGPVLELARSCDFEADLAWAIGLERRLTPHVSRDGSTVTVTFG
jgi:hypothetical protein